MNQDIAEEILHELFSSLETLDTQSTAILRFLKDRGIATDHDLAPYFEQAGNASNVRWLAARVRIDHLLQSATKPSEQQGEKQPPKESSKAAEGGEESPQRSDSDKSQAKGTDTEKGTESRQQAAASSNSEAHNVAASSQQERNQPAEEVNKESKSKQGEAA